MRILAASLTRTACLLLILSGVAVTTTRAQNPPRAREFTLTLTTSVMAPMFAMPSYPGMPPGMGGGSEPSRSIEGEAVYFAAAVEPIFVAVPATLGLRNNRLPLHVTRLEGMPIAPSGERVPGGSQRVRVDITTKQYWHPATAAGPLVENIHIDQEVDARGGNPPRLPRRAMERAGAALDRTATGEENVERMGRVGEGSYVLNTGSHSMPLDGFLLPITVTAPALLMQADLTQPLEIAWQPDTQARGWILHAVGMIMDGTQVKEIVRWVSTESVPPERVRDGYDPPPGFLASASADRHGRSPSAGIASDVAQRILLPPGSTRCVVPGGLFDRVDMLTITVTAIGDDYLGYSDSCTLRGRIRSTWTAQRMKSMAGMGAPPGAAGYPGMPSGFDPSAYRDESGE